MQNILTMKNSKIITTNITVNASREKVWEVLFTKFGDVVLYNPSLVGSHFTTKTSGEVGCERECRLDAKTFIRERITKADHLRSFTIDITGGNMPMVKTMQVDVELNSAIDLSTTVNIIANISTKPTFMAVLMKGMFKKKLTDMLIGLKYYIETGTPVSKKSFNPVFKSYKKLQLNQSFS